MPERAGGERAPSPRKAPGNTSHRRETWPSESPRRQPLRGTERQGGCARLEEACLSGAGGDFPGLRLPLPGETVPAGSGGGRGGPGSSSPSSPAGPRGRMPVLERYFHSAELGRRWTAPEGVLPSSAGGRPGCQQGPLPWDLPEMIRMVKLVWKSKSELQATKQRGVLENEDALHSFAGKLTVRWGAERYRGQGWWLSVPSSQSPSQKTERRQDDKLQRGVRGLWLMNVCFIVEMHLKIKKDVVGWALIDGIK